VAPIYQRPRTTVPHPEHRVYPYLLRDLAIDRPNQVWCADITYIPMRRGFLYLVAIMDWTSRKVLAWRVSNTMDVEFCLEALEEAVARFGKPEIFNTDSKSDGVGRSRRFHRGKAIDGLRPARNCVPGSHAGSATTMPDGLTRHWMGARQTRHMGP
jgi:transposase InsO family protein